MTRFSLAGSLRQCRLLLIAFLAFLACTDKAPTGLSPGDVETIFGITWTDNNVPLNQIGGCPNSFTLIHVGEFEVIGPSQGNGDVNRDGLVCIRSGGNGTIVIDNNHRT